MLHASINGRWVNGMWCIPPMVNDLARRRNAVSTHAAAWKDLENILVSERSQTQKDPMLDSCVSRTGKSTETESKFLAAGGLGGW